MTKHSTTSPMCGNCGLAVRALDPGYDVAAAATFHGPDGVARPYAPEDVRCTKHGGYPRESHCCLDWKAQ
ncbi:hypothetical protein LCGC14_1542790 [marine sediment metagenome]|uniref:Uncharacterized protein n=1 Tax=marine sediment metagenome TaxID=412755 RepID=A0A0F9L8M4_9ZZZZ